MPVKFSIDTTELEAELADFIDARTDAYEQARLDRIDAQTAVNDITAEQADLKARLEKFEFAGIGMSDEEFLNAAERQRLIRIKLGAAEKRLSQANIEERMAAYEANVHGLARGWQRRQLADFERWVTQARQTVVDELLGR